MQSFSFLFAAYTLVWIGVFAYLVSLARRNRALEREVQELRELIARQSGRSLSA